MKTCLILSSMLAFFLISSSLPGEGGEGNRLASEQRRAANEHWAGAQAHILNHGNRMFWLW